MSDRPDISTLNEALSSRYVVLREIGAGGMATVYLAQDVKHERQVAIKVFRPELAAAFGTDRFLTEIRVAANLHHPNLLPLFDSGEAAGLLYYVMPYVRGESLRARLDREGPFPVDEAVRIITAVSSALDHAHKHGVIHRDIKPENILVEDDEPVLTDFGIARALSTAGVARLTETGFSLGTPPYMSPEQASADRRIDGRSDTYSLATVLYEMLVGHPPFVAHGAHAVIAKILTEPAPHARAHRATVPEHIDDALQRALAKLPADRPRTVREFAAALNGDPGTQLPVAPSTGASLRQRTPRLRIALPAVIVVLGVSIALALFRRSPLLPLKVLEVPLDSIASMGANAVGVTLDISRDGSQLAFVGVAGERSGIFVTGFSGGTPRFVAGTEGGRAPGFSPDGKWLLFIDRDMRLKKVSMAGGPVVSLTDNAGMAHWGDDGEIFFNHENGIWRIPEGGGVARIVAMPDSAQGHVSYRMPHLLPGGEAALITITKQGDVPSPADLGVLSLRDGSVTELDLPGSNARYLADDIIVFGRGENAVFAAPFSLRRLRVTGPAIPVLADVVVKSGGATLLAVATDGTAVYEAAPTDAAHLVFVDIRGRSRTLTRDARAYREPRVAPDAGSILVTVGPHGNSDIWLFDLSTATMKPLTVDGRSSMPEWWPDRNGIAYMSMEDPLQWVLRTRSDDGEGPVEHLLADSVLDVGPISLGPPGSYAAVWMSPSRLRTNLTRDIFIAPLAQKLVLRPFLTSRADEYQPKVSPDGTLLAYVSNESGQDEVYVRPLDSGAAKRVSTGRGTEPVWSRTGNALFYREPGRLLAATFTRIPEFKVLDRDTLFADSYDRGGNSVNYDVMPGDKSFVMVHNVSPANRLFALINWRDEVKRKLASNSTTGEASRR